MNQIWKALKPEIINKVLSRVGVLTRLFEIQNYNQDCLKFFNIKILIVRENKIIGIIKQFNSFFSIQFCRNIVC